MKICVYGAGAVGGHIAGTTRRRSDRGLGDRARSAARRDPAHGLRVETHDRTLTSHPVVTDQPGDLEPQDIVIVAVKAPILPKIAEGVGSLLHQDSLVLFVGNGIPWWYFHSHGGALDGTQLTGWIPTRRCGASSVPQRAVGVRRLHRGQRARSGSDPRGEPAQPPDHRTP